MSRPRILVINPNSNTVVTRGLEEALKRDHRKLGRELKLFSFSDELPAGVPMFYPRGEMLRHLMETYVRDTQEKYGYQHVWTSNLGKVHLYKTSRHWYTYRENMFPVMKGELMLGTWQAVYLIEHRRRPHRRDIVLQFAGHTR